MPEVVLMRRRAGMTPALSKLRKFLLAFCNETNFLAEAYSPNEQQRKENQMSKTKKKVVKPSRHSTALLDIIMSALAAKWYIPEETPETGYPHLTREALRALHIDKVKGGYVANVEFQAAPGLPNTIGTPDAHPLPSRRDAFLAGAALVSEIVTGERDLPFFVFGDELIVATVTAQGKPLVMRQPFPPQCA